MATLSYRLLNRVNDLKLLFIYSDDDTVTKKYAAVIELLPPDGDVFAPYEKWTYHFLEPSTLSTFRELSEKYILSDSAEKPEWFDSQAEDVLRKYYEERIWKHMYINGECKFSIPYINTLATKKEKQVKLNQSLSGVTFRDGIYRFKDCHNIVGFSGIRSNAAVELYGDTKMYFNDHDMVTAYDDSICNAYKKTSVKAYNRSKVFANDESVVWGYDSTKIRTYNNSTAHLFDKSYAEAYKDSIINAYEESVVNAYGNSTVHLHDDAEVYAFDNSTVIIDCRLSFPAIKESRSKEILLIETAPGKQTNVYLYSKNAKVEVWQGGEEPIIITLEETINV